MLFPTSILSWQNDKLYTNLQLKPALVYTQSEQQHHVQPNTQPCSHRPAACLPKPWSTKICWSHGGKHNCICQLGSPEKTGQQMAVLDAIFGSRKQQWIMRDNPEHTWGKKVPSLLAFDKHIPCILTASTKLHTSAHRCVHFLYLGCKFSTSGHQSPGCCRWGVQMPEL